MQKWLIPLLGFIVAFVAGGAVSNMLLPYLGTWGGGITGTLVSGVIVFAVYVMIVSRWKQAEPT